MTDDLEVVSKDTLNKILEMQIRIEKLEALVEQLRDDNSSLIDSFDKDFLRQESRIEQLEAALLEIFDHECRTSDKSFIARVARDALWPQALEDSQ